MYLFCLFSSHPYASSLLKRKVKRNFTFLFTCLPSSLSSLGLPWVSLSPLSLFPVLLFSAPYTVSVKCAGGSRSHVKELFRFAECICIPGLIVLSKLSKHWYFAVLLSPHHRPTLVISYTWLLRTVVWNRVAWVINFSLTDPSRHPCLSVVPPWGEHSSMEAMLSVGDYM